ncbi:hypothetical protein SH449x_001052 [Pirellulaceae bacterium SH449]
MMATTFIKCSIWAATTFSVCPHVAISQELASSEIETNVSREGAWDYIRGANTIARRTLVLAPKAEHKPALAIRFIPDSFHAKPGNAAIYYLKAGGYFEQSSTQQARRKFEEESRQAANGKEYAPYIWLETEMKDLPVDEMKTFLSFTSFQRLFLEEASARLHCDFDRQMRTIENPIGYLLPEIQSIRDIARLQAMRFLVAMAENRTDDAVKILGQMIAMGPHLSQEPFLVSNLVGAACVGLGMQQAHYLSEHADAPNLYWAIAQLPNPLIDLSQSLAYEREFLFQQVKVLQEVDETPKPNIYWNEFLDRFTQSMKGMGSSSDEMEVILSSGKAGLTLAIGANVPKAREYLVAIEGMDEEKLDMLPNTQIFFLAMRRFYERYRDEEFKYSFLPNHAREKAKSDFAETRGLLRQYGVIITPTFTFLPSVQVAQAASARYQQQIALWQTIESIRHHLATNNNTFPVTLAELELPVPHDPVSSEPFEYMIHEKGVTLKGAANPGLQYQFELRTKSSRP